MKKRLLIHSNRREEKKMCYNKNHSNNIMITKA